jgi:CheY-like chemotaxis protein
MTTLLASTVLLTPALLTEGVLGIGLSILCLATAFGLIVTHRDTTRALAAPPQPQRDARTILVVDDNEPLVRILQQVLDGAGFRTLTALNANDGLATLVKLPSPVNAILTDMMMPGMSGGEFIATVRSRYPNVPVIRMSGMPHIVQAAREDGSAEMPVLAKPVSRRELLDTLNRMLGVPAL